METDGFINPMDLSVAEIIPGVVSEMTASQVALHKSTRELANAPSQAALHTFNEMIAAADKAFKETVVVIASCEEFTTQERAKQISSICVDVEEARLLFLQDLVPEGSFFGPPFSKEDLAEGVETLFWQGLDAVTIAERAEAAYSENYRLDLEEVFKFLDPPVEH